MNIELNSNQVDSIVAEDLKRVIKHILKDPYALYHDNEEALALVGSLLDVLDYYTTAGQYNEFYKEIFFELFTHIIKNNKPEEMND